MNKILNNLKQAQATLVCVLLSLCLCGCSLPFGKDGRDSKGAQTEEVQSETESSMNANDVSGVTSDVAGADASSEISPAGESTGNADEEQAEVYVDPEDGYSYRHLTEAERNAYRQIRDHIASRESEFSIDIDSVDNIMPALTSIMDDHPEFFWIDGSASYSGFEGERAQLVTINFTMDASEIDRIQAEIDARVNEFLSSVAGLGSAYEKVKAAYEYIILNTDYGFDSAQNQNIQSVFIDHVSVCAGYTRAFQYLLDRMGIYSAYITGTITKTGDAHAWNAILIDDTWTYADAAWGDPTYGADAEDSAKLDIIYDYLCLTASEMERDYHKPDADIVLPDASSGIYDYYRLGGMFYDTYSPETLSTALTESVNSGSDMVCFKFGDDAVYASAMYGLFDGGLLEDALQEKMNRDGLKSIQYYYSCSEELRIIKIYW